MNHGSPPAQSREKTLPQRVEDARRHWASRPQPDSVLRDLTYQPSHRFTIALSREVGTRGTSVALEVGRLLGWHVYDHELLESIAQDMQLRTDLIENVDEREHGWLVETIGAFISGPKKSDWNFLASESAYVHHLIETVLALGTHGECVIVGRGAAFILPAATTLRVRLVGPVRERIETLVRTLGVSEREAASRVRANDRERTDFIQDHFFKDPSDPRNFDLVVNVSRLSVVQVAELIVETLRRLQATDTEKNTGKPCS